jgi:hypothetical protein
VFSNLLPGNDSFAAIPCNGNVISEPLLSNGRLALAPLFRLSAVTPQCVKGRKATLVIVYQNKNRYPRRQLIVISSLYNSFLISKHEYTLC